MIKCIILQNVRSWAGEHTIEFSQLTLIYGANSAGKSTLFHALGVLRQTLEIASEERARLVARGRWADGGNFEALVFEHDLKRTMSIGLQYLTRNANSDSLVGNAEVLVQADFVHDSDQRNASGAFLSRITIEARGRTLVFSRHSATEGLQIEKSETLIDLIFELNPSLLADMAQDAAQLSGAARAFADVRFYFSGGLPAIGRVLASPPQAAVGRKPSNSERSHDVSRALTDDLPGSASTQPEPTDGEGSPATRREPSDGDEQESAPSATTRALLLETWNRFCREISEGFFEEMKQIRHLGPMRELPEQVTSVEQGSVVHDNVGASGQFLSQVLSDPELTSRVNKVLERFDPVYQLHVQSHEFDGGEVAVAVALVTPAGIRVKLRDVGFGISQSIPIVVQLMARDGLVHIIEQPETHVHPSMAVHLAQVMVETIVKMPHSQILCETHSAEVLLRIQRRISEDIVSYSKVSILFVEQDSDGKSSLRELEINKFGALLEEWPHKRGSFNERNLEIFKLGA